MKKSRLAVVLAALVVCPVLVSAQDVSGTWTASFETQVGQQNYTFEFMVTGTALTGVAKSELAETETEITEGTVEGDTITFVENLNFQGMPLRIVYTGKVTSADEIALSRNVGDIATEEAVAKRTE